MNEIKPSDTDKPHDILLFEGGEYQLIKSNIKLSKKEKWREQFTHIVGGMALTLDVIEFVQAFLESDIKGILTHSAFAILIVAVFFYERNRKKTYPYIKLNISSLEWSSFFFWEKSVRFSEVESIHIEIDIIHFLMKEGREEKCDFSKKLRGEKNRIFHEELILIAEKLKIPFTLSKTKNDELLQKYPERIGRYKVESRYVGH